LLASLARSEDIALPERHLGLVQAEEVAEELEQRFDAGADWLEEAGAKHIIDKLTPVTFTDVEIAPVQAVTKKVLSSTTIAIAKDAAFSFIYPSNIELLKAMGANIVFFSPLKDTALPEADALWLPGGYPELHAKALSKNTSLLNDITLFFEKRKPILAECGGFLYCLETLTDLTETTYPMADILSGHGAMRGKRGCQGMQTAPLPEGDVCGHAHHRSRSSDTPTPIAHGKRQRHPAPGEAIYRHGSLTATYLHLFFTSNPDAIAQLFSPRVTQPASISKESSFV
jgi:cobyrinic acid a,c-diamide synthase